VDSHLPAAREVIIDIDKNIHVNAKGLPVCEEGGQLSGRVEVAFPEQKPIMVSSPLTMFNGGVKGGKTTIFIHAFITVPVPAAIVTTVKITPSAVATTASTPFRRFRRSRAAQAQSPSSRSGSTVNSPTRARRKAF
jgi:hypothetical protein